MTLDWIPRDNEMKDHRLFGDEHWGGEAPCTTYEKRPLVDPDGREIEGLYTAWVTLNNPKQFNSYTTEMAKGVTAGFSSASADRSVVAVVFTAAGERAFCTGGNTKEYAEYYANRPNEYGEYMDIFNGMVDAILNCKKPTICRVNGMRVAGGQEVSVAWEFPLSLGLAIFGRAGPPHGSAPDGGSTDFLPWMLSIEDAMWNCVSCEMWSAYKMKVKGLITAVKRALRVDGEFVPNPLVITDRYVEDGEIVYGEFKTGDAAKQAKALLKSGTIDLSLLDREVASVVWRLANLFPGCLMKSIDGIRSKKKYFWDMMKLPNRHWLSANMSNEAYLGFTAFNTRKITGKDTIDFVRYRQLIAEGREMDATVFEEVLGKPQE